jgi:hypothetical protein
MKLRFAEQVSYENALNQQYDIFIAASGYESRATHLAKNVHKRCCNKFVIAFQEHKEHKQRIQNDNIFNNFGFIAYEAREGKYEEIIYLLDQILSTLLFEKAVSVLVDYSCMTKVWYATIINYFMNKYSEIEKLNVTFSYSPSSFSAPMPPMPNKYMGPIPGIYRVSTSSKPTALILGLGYEKDAAKGIVEYLDPKVTYAFYSKPALDARFEGIVEENNDSLIRSLGVENIFTHPINDLKTTDSLLSSLCVNLRKTHRVILAPLGPKPFALMCFLVATKYLDIDVWRVSSGASGNIYDRLPADVNPIICKITFEQEVKKVVAYT